MRGHLVSKLLNLRNLRNLRFRTRAIVMSAMPTSQWSQLANSWHFHSIVNAVAAQIHALHWSVRAVNWNGCGGFALLRGEASGRQTGLVCCLAGLQWGGDRDSGI